eukprot:Nk52_evm38s2039 gene=Nk52_evmTU38s2039
MGKSKPRVAVIGTGWACRIQVPILQHLGYDVVALWARTQKKAESFCEKLSIKGAYSSVDDIVILPDVDLVLVSTAPHLHAEVSVKALSAGKHVVCAGPPSLTAKGALKMLYAAIYYPQLLSVFDFSLRFMPNMQKIRSLVDDGYCGKLHVLEVRISMGTLIDKEYNWWCDGALGGGVLNNLGAHVIDLLTYLAGGAKITDVHGLLHTFVKENEYVNGFRHITSDDYCTFKVRMEGGLFGNVTIDTHAPGNFVQEVSVIGTHGRLKANETKLVGNKNLASKSDSQVNVSNLNLSSSAHFFERSKFENFVNEEKLKDIKGVQFTQQTRNWVRPSKDANEKSMSIEEFKELNLKLRASTKSVYDSVPFVNGSYYFFEGIKRVLDKIGDESCTEMLEDIKESCCPGLANFADGLYVQRVVDAVKLSSDTGRWVTVDHTSVDGMDEKASGPFWTQKQGPSH